jgi:hypothetical protein
MIRERPTLASITVQATPRPKHQNVTLQNPSNFGAHRFRNVLTSLVLPVGHLPVKFFTTSYQTASSTPSKDIGIQYTVLRSPLEVTLTFQYWRLPRPMATCRPERGRYREQRRPAARYAFGLSLAGPLGSGCSDLGDLSELGSVFLPRCRNKLFQRRPELYIDSDK